MSSSESRDPQKSPSGMMWLGDFKAILVMAQPSAEAVETMIYERYPDSGFAHEYAFAIWNAYCYFLKHRTKWDELGLTVEGQKQSIVKDSLFLALYTPFLSCPLETMHKLDFDAAAIAASAKELEKRNG